MDVAEELRHMTEDLHECNKQLREIFEIVKMVIAQRNKTIEKLTKERDMLKKKLEGKK